jgi:uncharacterized caspase-like protein
MAFVVRIVFGLLLSVGMESVAWSQTDGRRVALVIGNSAYRSIASLANPANDANLIASALEARGFEIVGGRAFVNLDKRQFEAAFEQFSQRLRGADVALFFYAGHGIQVGGTNWLVPTSAAIRAEQDVPVQLIDLNVVLARTSQSGARLTVVILDACRNNPFAEASAEMPPDSRGVGGRRGGVFRSGSPAGLAMMTAPNDMILAYSTQPGNVALDGNDGNSPYSKALAFGIRTFRAQPIAAALNNIGVTVSQQTNNAQRPWISMSPIAGNFSFDPPSDAPQATTENAWLLGRWAGNVEGFGERIFVVERVGQQLACSWGGSGYPVAPAQCNISGDRITLTTGMRVEVSLRRSGSELVGSFTPRQASRNYSIRMKRLAGQ